MDLKLDFLRLTVYCWNSVVFVIVHLCIIHHCLQRWVVTNWTLVNKMWIFYLIFIFYLAMIKISWWWRSSKYYDDHHYQNIMMRIIKWWWSKYDDDDDITKALACRSFSTTTKFSSSFRLIFSSRPFKASYHIMRYLKKWRHYDGN